ncbi:MAG: EAL domain-containing protein [Candidatus Velthaea sp.]|jgi:diguanylate cyclase (GGDEF)-like protein/PAS domain S-box-containing protein
MAPPPGSARFLEGIAEAEQARQEQALLKHPHSVGSQIGRIAGYEHEVDCGKVRCSGELCSIFGIDPSTFRGTHAELLEGVHPDDRERVLNRDRALVRDQTSYDEFRSVWPDGTVRILRRSARAVADAQGWIVRVFATVQDVTDQRQAELEHRALEVRFQRAFESAPFGMSLVSARPESFGGYVQANDAYCRMVGYSQEELLTMAVWSVVHPDEMEHYLRVVHDLQAGRTTAVQREVRMRHRDGSLIWVRQHRSLVRDDSGQPLYFFSHSEDVTQRKIEQAALNEATQRLHHCFENAPIGIALLSVDPADPGRYLELNRAACRMTGYSREEMLQLRSQQLTHPDDVAEDARALQSLIAGGVESYESEKRFVRSDGTIVWCLIHRSLVRDAEGKPLYCVGQVVDVSARKRAEEQLRHLADHDTLTGLLNRRGFEHALTRHLAEVQRYRRHSALLMIDLDHFKYVNDTLGHAAGDELLRKVSKSCGQRCRSSDVLARLGGDEFAVILLEADAITAQSVANDLCGAICEEARLGDALNLQVTASIGILPLDAATQLTAEQAMVAVDIAMYQAKDAGRDRVQVATATTDSQATMQAQLGWLERLRNAVHENAFVLFGQPIMNLANGTIDRCEVLVRLRDADGSMIAPAVFLPVAERFGLMHQIDTWVVQQAIQFVAAEQQAGRTVQVEINLSGSSLTDASVLACIENELERTRVDPRALVFEVTETIAIGNIAEACGFARRLSDLGCAFALDDFGAGFSSFYYLKHLPFDYLKIDGEFIRNFTQNADDQQIVKAIVQMATGLGKKTIAEFVADDATVKLLRQYGVDFAQGYHIGKPRPLSEVHMLPARSN